MCRYNVGLYRHKFLLPHQIKSVFSEFAKPPFAVIFIVQMRVGNEASLRRARPVISNSKFVRNTKKIIKISTANHQILDMPKSTVVLLPPRLFTTILEVRNALPIRLGHKPLFFLRVKHVFGTNLIQACFSSFRLTIFNIYRN